ncbi:MAG: cation:proton antiporter [Burkholderiales bacterium]|nr:cation:proton antiporter [Burkholderiales bacterium]
MDLSAQPFTQALVLLGAGVAGVMILQRLRVPSAIAYLLVGLLLGPHTPGPVIEGLPVRAVAEFGVVFLLFTIGLAFSLPQLAAMRHSVLGLGTAQVLVTTAVIGGIGWLAGLPPAAAFVAGAVFAQSSSTIISKQLMEQGEEQSRHGRLAMAMSVFQDVTAAPFIVIIPVLAGAASAPALAVELVWTLGKAVLAFALVVGAGHWLLRPLFRAVAARRSAELFTLTVLFVSLAAAWTTDALGLSMAFGAFLAGMMLGETEFRHQVESTIRPFRDVLVGLFFVGIGMLFDPAAVAPVWHVALAVAAAVLAVKAAIVAGIVRWSGIDALTAWRTGLALAVGGEFGLALLAIALEAGATAPGAGQVILAAVLLSMIAGPFLIRHDRGLAARLAPRGGGAGEEQPLRLDAVPSGTPRGHVVICGYGRIGQSVANFLEKEGIPFVALDLDPERVREARLGGEPVFYGDAAERDMLEAAGVASARLVVVSHGDVAAARKILHHVRALRPELPVMVRTRDEAHAEELRAAGATEVVPETLEAGLMIASHALLLLDVPLSRIVRRIDEQRSARYRLLRELFRGGSPAEEGEAGHGADRLRPVPLAPESPAVGRALGELGCEGVMVTALVRNGRRELAPAPETRLAAGDVVVLFGPPGALERAARALAG